MALTRVSGGILQQPIDVGIITATSIQVGSGTTIHDAGIDLGSGNITSHNINSTGIVTSTGLDVNGNGDISGDLSVSGNVSIGGTLTYEDVTNVDSVGLITARDGIIVTGGSVGIGTDNASRKLHIHESSATNTYLQLSNSTTGSGTDDGFQIVCTGSTGQVSLIQRENQPLTFQTNNTEKLRITSGGRVGLGSDGVSSPQSVLHVFSNSSTDTIKIQAPTSSGDYDAGFEVLRDTTAGGAKMVAKRNTVSGGVGWEWLTTANNTAEVNATYTSRMVLTESGTVGIGTDNPSAKLHISDTSGALIINRELDAVNQINFRTLNSQRGSIGANSSACFTVYDASSAERLRITSSGAVGINTTAPQATLDVWGDVSITNQDGGIAFSDPDNKAEHHVLYMKSGDNSLNFKTYNGTDGWVDRVKLNTNGSIGINTTSVDDAAQVQIRGSSDGVLNLDTTDGRGSFIRFKENGTTKAWVGCSEGLGTGGDQDDLGLRAVDNIFFQTGTSNKVSINSSGTLSVSNSDTGNDSAVNILKSSGDNADKAILRVGFDASNCFEIYRTRTDADIYLNTTQSGAETRIQYLSKDVATISDRGALSVGKLTPKVVQYSIANWDGNFNADYPTRFHLYYSTGGSSATHHFARMITQTDWTFCKWTVKQIKMQYTPTSSDLATWDNTGSYSSHNFYVSNFNQGGNTSGGGNYNLIGRNQNLGPGGTFQIHDQANGGYYRNCWATDYYVSLPAYIHVMLEITVYHFGGNAWDTSTPVTDIYPASFGGSATQAQADSWNVGRGIWFDAAPGSFKMRSGTTTGVMWDT